MTPKQNGADLLDAPAIDPTTQALAPVDSFASVVERLAANPDVDVTKLEKIIELQERVMRHNAKAAFDAAFAKMRPGIPQIDEKGRIEVKGSLRATYARLEDIDEIITPILSTFGFAVRHRTEWPTPGLIRVVGILAHEQGHSEESAFEAPMDRSEYRTDIQSQGSTISYGRRYTTCDLLNIITKRRDDDGQKSGRPQPPNGYDAWWQKFTPGAKLGLDALTDAWKTAPAEFKTYTVNHNKEAYAQLKRDAESAGGRS